MNELRQMNVSITTYLSEYVQVKIRGGLFNNASEVVREALRRMEQEDMLAVQAAKPTAEDLIAFLSAEEIRELRRRIRAVAGPKKRSASAPRGALTSAPQKTKS